MVPEAPLERTENGLAPAAFDVGVLQPVERETSDPREAYEPYAPGRLGRSRDGDLP
ncbi:MAG: hypothetical protein ICV64_09610 [Thermoleophilia bacterium]|nr:hypothetical protein [Thermoleophilia bacterium]